MSRRIVRHMKTEWDSYDLVGSVGKLIEKLEELRAVHGDDLKVNCNLYDAYGSSYCSVQFYKDEPETDEDVAKREQQAAIYANSRRQQYEQLKKEFGNDEPSSVARGIDPATDQP